MSFSAFENIERTITGNIADLLQQVGNLISEVSPIFAGLFSIYLMLWVFNYWANGGVVEMGVDFLKKLVVWSVVIGFCFNAGEYAKWAEIIYNFSTDLSGALTGASYSTSAMDTNWGNVDTLLTQLESKGAKLEWYEIRTSVILSLWIAFYKICLLIYILMMFVYLLIAKLSLLAVLMVGPLFLGFLMFPTTRQYGMNWINQCANYTITILLLVVLGVVQDKVFVNMMYPAIENMGKNEADASLAILLLVGNLALIFCSTIIFTLMATKVPAIASALTGGSAQASGFSMRGVGGKAANWAANTKLGWFKNLVTPK